MPSSFRTFPCPRCKSRLHIDKVYPKYLDLTHYDWSDGYKDFPFLWPTLRDIHPISRCPACSELFRNDEISYDAEEVPEPQGDESRITPEEPLASDYLSAVWHGLARSDEEKIAFYTTVWHHANSRIRRHIQIVTEKGACWVRSEEELKGFIEEVDHYFLKLKKFEDSLQRAEANLAGIDDRALLRHLTFVLKREAPQLLAGEGEKELAEAFEKGISHEQRNHLTSYVCTFFGYFFPNVPEAIQNFYNRHIYSLGNWQPPEYVWAWIETTRDEVQQALKAIRSFRYTSEELSCLSLLAELLKSGNRFLLVELLRETGEFDLALAHLEREVELSNPGELRIDAIRWACEQRLPYVFEIGKERELGQAIHLIEPTSD